jgi:Dolichyl-phosphate-mannose-protein mannosyltransferase
MRKIKERNWLNERDRNTEDRAFQKQKFFQHLSLFFLFFGILVRLIQYINNRSLWDDEASIAINIVNRSYLGLINSLERNQAAPPGFLWIEKFFVQLLGNNEFALRLFPLIAGLISLFVFYKLAIRYTSELAVPIAIALFSCLRYTLYYATEVKQYSSDIMVTLLAFWLLISLRYKILGKKQILFLSILGSIFIWLSHPAIFSLSGLELSFLLIARKKRRLNIILNRLPIYITWLLSFALLYFLSISSAMQNNDLNDSWGDSYPDSWFDIVWLLDAFGRFFYHPLGFSGITDGVAIFAFICGCIAYYKTNRRVLLFLTAPFLTTLIASYLHKYPFRDRLLLFLAPFAILIIAEGIVFLITQFRRYKYVTILGIFVLILLVAPPAINASQLIVRPQLKEEIRPVLEYIKSHQQPGDTLYVYARANSAFTYYAEKYGYEEGEYIIGDGILLTDGDVTQEDWQLHQQEIDMLRGKQRVWLLYRGNEQEKAEISSYLNKIGQQIDFYSQPGIFVYLYNLTRSPL